MKIPTAWNDPGPLDDEPLRTFFAARALTNPARGGRAREQESQMNATLTQALSEDPNGVSPGIIRTMSARLMTHRRYRPYRHGLP